MVVKCVVFISSLFYFIFCIVSFHFSCWLLLFFSFSFDCTVHSLCIAVHLTCFVCKRFACVRVCVCVYDNNCGMHCYIVQVIHHPNVKYNKSCDCERKLKCECELRFQDKRTQHLIRTRKIQQCTYANSMFLWLVNCKRCLFSTSTTTKIVQYFVYCNSNISDSSSSSSSNINNKRENAHKFSRVLFFHLGTRKRYGGKIGHV